MIRTFAIAIFVITAASAVAQEWPPALFLPAAPTSRDRILSVFEIPGCIPLPTVAVTGTVIRETIRLGCVQGPPPFMTRYYGGFGPLPANTYTYEVYFDYGRGDPPVLRSTQQLVVTEAVEVPTLSAAALMLTGIALAFVALRASGRA